MVHYKQRITNSLWTIPIALFVVTFLESVLVLGNVQHHGKYNLEVEDLNDFCPLAGFDEFDTTSDVRSEGKECFMYQWTPDPCTMERSGRIDSDMLHCGHYSMVPCISTEGRSGLDDGLLGYDLPWGEVHDLCDVVQIKNRTHKKKKVKPMYWKWIFCENEMGTELRPCGHYAMTLYAPGMEPQIKHTV